jgi:hypothetical protein
LEKAVCNGGIIMNANKIFAGLMVLIVAMMVVPNVLAETQDTNATLDSNTMMELKAMHNPLGAQIRLLQLEKNLTKNILVGNEVLNVIATNHPDANVEAAQTIMSQLEILLNEAKTAASGTDTNIQAQQFVEIKNEAITLTQQFRDQTRIYLDGNDHTQLRGRSDNIDRNELRNMNDDIKHAVNEYNSDRIKEFLDAIGDANSSAILDQIAQGRALIQDAQNQIRNAYDALTPEQKQEASTKIKELGLKRNIQERNIIDKAVQNLGPRMMQRDNNKGPQLRQWMNQIKAEDDLNHGIGDRVREMIRDTNFVQNINERMDIMQGRRGRN